MLLSPRKVTKTRQGRSVPRGRIEHGAESDRPQKAKAAGKLLRFYRQQARLTQEALCELLEKKSDAHGPGYAITRSAISRYERGDRPVPPELVYYASRLLRLNADQENDLIMACYSDWHTTFHARINKLVKAEGGTGESW